MFIAGIEERAARLARNPHNLNLAAYGGAMALETYWRARFEREGMNARPDASNPHKAGTLAANAWQTGRDYINRNGEAAA